MGAGVAHRRRRRGATFVILATLAVVGLPVAHAPSAGAAEARRSPVRTVGKLPVLWPKGWKPPQSDEPVFGVSLVLNPATRRAYQIFGHAVAASPQVRGAIQSFDLDTLRPLRFATLGLAPVHVLNLAAGEHIHALDQQGNRLFLSVQVRKEPCLPGCGRTFDKTIAVVDLNRFERGDKTFVTKLFDDLGAGRPQLELNLLSGISFFRAPDGRGKLLLALKEAYAVSLGPGLDRPLVDQWDAETGQPDWPAPATAPCAHLAGSGHAQVPVWRSPSGRAIFTLCTTSGVGGVARINLGPDGRPLPGGEYFPGVQAPQDGLADPERDRLLIYSRATSGDAVVVFDGRTSSYVGKIGHAQNDVSSSNGLGLDRDTGRLYALVPHHYVDFGGKKVPVRGGLFLADSRLSPPPQGVWFPEYARKGTPLIQVDPARGGRPRRIFLRRAASGGLEFTYPEGKEVPGWPPEDFYLVIQDDLPLARQPEPRDLDPRTIDRPEEDGVTGRNFQALGSAYGARLRLLGGIEGAARPANDDYTVYPQYQMSEPVCWPTDREAVAGEVGKAELSSLPAAKGEARPRSVDASTREDLSTPAQRCQPRAPERIPEDLCAALALPRDSEPCRRREVPIPWEEIDGIFSREEVKRIKESTKRDWEAPPATCTGTGATDWSPDAAGDASRARAECKPDGVGAEALSAPLTGSEIHIGESFGSVRVWPDTAGVHVRSEAWARAVEIGPVRIELVRTLATSRAGGRKGTARTTFERWVCGVHAPGLERPGCLTRQELDEVIPRINQAFDGRVRLALPAPDPVLARGTPRGYLAAVQRNRAEALSAEIVERDYRLEVAGLEVVIYRDAQTRGATRQIVHLAGVRAETALGIICLTGDPPECQPAPDGPIPALGPRPGPGGNVALPGAPGPEAPPVAPPGPGFASPPAPRPARIFGVLFRPLGEGALSSAVWLALALPFYLAWRRGSLLRRFGGGGV